MKILIVGSKKPEDDPVDAVVGRHDDPETPQPIAAQFEDACRGIGAALAGNERTIIVGSAEEGTADRYVLEGANEVEGKHNVIVIRPDDGRSMPASEDFPNLNIISRRRGQTWTVGRAFQIKEADLVVAIGGGRGTMQTGLMAPALETPTLAIRAFPGAAHELWKTYQTDYERADLSERDLGILQETKWSEDSAEVIARAAASLVKRNPYQVNLIPALLGLMAMVLLIMAGWIMLFLNPDLLPFVGSKSAYSYATFILLGLAALLGAGMRTALPMLEGRVISLMQLISEMIVGIFLAFGFMLVYLATSILVIGQVSIDEEGFRNAAVTTSLMGFAVAFFAERAANQLREHLGERL